MKINAINRIMKFKELFRLLSLLICIVVFFVALLIIFVHLNFYKSSMGYFTQPVFVIELVLIIMGIIIILFVAFLGLKLNNSIEKTMDKVNCAAKQIASGDLSTRLEIDGDSEANQLFESVNFMADKLESNEKMKNDFLSSVSHELRTPLTAIKGWGETVKLSIDDPELVERGVTVMLTETERLAVLVEDLLDFSLIQAGRSNEKMDPVDILCEVDDAVITYQEIAKQRDIKIMFSKELFVPLINGNKKRLRQAFDNIIDNAVKYSSAGDTIAVSVGVDNGNVLITVEDTGCGIAEKDLDYIKQKFYKANNEVRGWGIGLAVCDDIVKLHKGLLIIESKQNKGTKVTVKLPLTISN